MREKLNWLEELLAASSTNDNYLSRFLEIVAYCHWVDAQRERLLRVYCGNKAWPLLTPLGELADRLTNAGRLLEESMMCEHGDYKLASVYFRSHVRRSLPWSAKAEKAKREDQH
jgi:hypothetical protein